MSWITVFVFTSILGTLIGHAIEATAGYGKVMHGEAVAMGMVQISKVAEEKGLMPEGITQSITAMCQKFGLPVDYEKMGC